MKLKKIKIKRLWHGFASVRDYLVEEAKQKKQGLEIYCLEKNDKIIVPYKDLDKGYKNEQEFDSRYGNKKYTLIDYDWNTFKKKTPEQIQLDITSSLFNLKKIKNTT